MNKKSSNQKEQYKGYALKVTENTKETGENRFSGKAYKQDDSKPKTEARGKNRDEVLNSLKENIDGIEERRATPSITENAEPEKSTSEPVENETAEQQTTQDVSDDKKENVVSEKSKGTPKNQSNNSDSSASIEKLLEKHFSSISKKIETIGERLEKLESNRELTSKIEALTQITRQNQNNTDKFSSDFAEKLQVQEQRLVDILSKIDTLAEAEFLNGHLTQLQLQSEKLHERLDNKIDLKDAEHLFDLRNEIEKEIQNHLIQTISKKIMPVIETLKDKIKNEPEKISDAVQDLENRCMSAGLKLLRGI